LRERAGLDAGAAIFLAGRAAGALAAAAGRGFEEEDLVLAMGQA
jgi:hypothetical protein